MKKHSILAAVVLPILVILVAAFLRLIPHPANVAPIAAMALFGGIYLDKKYALVIPLVALFLSDMVLGFYTGMAFVYGSFLLSGGIGMWIQKHKSPRTVILGCLLSSTLFFIITNFGVWLFSTMYPKSITGVISCYTLALPFFRNTLVGDIIYTGVLIAGYKTVLALTEQLLISPSQRN